MIPYPTRAKGVELLTTHTVYRAVGMLLLLLLLTIVVVVVVVVVFVVFDVCISRRSLWHISRTSSGVACGSRR